MPLGPRVRRTAVALLASAVAAPALSGCGLFDRGTPLEEAFEYLPADSYEVVFAHRAAMAERIGSDDVDPRAVSDEDVADYGGEIADGDEIAGTRLARYADAMQDAPVNEFDVEWEASARWGDARSGEDTSAATVWKVGDDVDFDELADDLEAAGYTEDEVAGLQRFSADVRDADPVTGLIDETFPTEMASVVLDPDEHLVVGAVFPDPLEDVAEVVADDADSLADDGGFDGLAEAVDDVEFAWLRDGAAACTQPGGRIPPEVQARYEHLGIPERRALLVTGEGDPRSTFVLQYADDAAAEDDLAAREELVEEGTDPLAGQPFAELGDFTVEQDGDLLLIEAELERDPSAALAAERSGGGPAYCVSEG